jgi:4-hydroxybenzoate polyprenyltransferase
MPAENPRLHPAHAGAARVADAIPGNWVDRWAPAAARPYLRLARFDRPIGALLLLFPCWWSQALAEVSLGHAYPNVWYLVLFYVGATVMRGAGCTWNDIVDRDIDAGVGSSSG